MGDLVERAREYARNLGGPPEDYLVWQMADRVEALEAENAAMKKTLQGYRLAWMASNAHIGRMTVALEAAGLSVPIENNAISQTDRE
jgi:hypothetical protein